MNRATYGYELILDLHNCDLSRFEGSFFGFRFIMMRHFLRSYCKVLCKSIHMEACKLTFWNDRYTLPWRRETNPKTKGTSAVQFIITSNITIHYLSKLNAAYINVFSCKSFDPAIVEHITKLWFNTEECTARFIERI